MIHLRPVARLLVAGLFLTALLPIAPARSEAAGPPPPGRLFQDTGHMLDPQFAAFYDGNSGTRLLGSPLTESYQDGGHLVQVFERGRLELDPSTHKAILSPLGQLFTAGRPADPPAAPPADGLGTLYDATTGHSVGVPFAGAWYAAGGASGLGRPISEMSSVSGRSVQYFEWARLESDAKGQVTAQLMDNARGPGSPFAAVSQPASTKGLLYVPATGHVVSGGFLDTLKGLGGVEVAGAPLTEEVVENGVTVQYFAAAKLVYDASAAKGKQLSVAPLGRLWLVHAGHLRPEQWLL